MLLTDHLIHHRERKQQEELKWWMQDYVQTVEMQKLRIRKRVDKVKAKSELDKRKQARDENTLTLGAYLEYKNVLQTYNNFN